MVVKVVEDTITFGDSFGLVILYHIDLLFGSPVFFT